jgi:hypothetical protein
MALSTIDKVAHWDHRVENKEICFQDYITTLWTPKKKDLWLAHEPITDWNLTFFSRTMPRGDHLSLEQFNYLCDQQGSDYFKKTWRSGKIILDFLNKNPMPIWWIGSMTVKLDADLSDPKYRSRLLDKIYLWDNITGIGCSMMDKPMPEQKYHNAILYDNKWQHGPFESSDCWLNWVIENDDRINFSLSPADIKMHDLLDYKKVYNLVTKIAENLKSDIQEKDLKFLHDYWSTRC